MRAQSTHEPIKVGSEPRADTPKLKRLYSIYPDAEWREMRDGDGVLECQDIPAAKNWTMRERPSEYIFAGR
jgi:hypothetical protein